MHHPLDMGVASWDPQSMIGTFLVASVLTASPAATPVPATGVCKGVHCATLLLGHQDVLNRLRHALDCGPKSTDALRTWCAATKTDGAGFTAPRGKVSHLGLSVATNVAVPVREALSEVSLTLVSFNDGQVTVRALKPSNAEEAKQLAALMQMVTAGLNGKANEIQVGKELGAFIDLQTDSAATTGYPIHDDAKGAQVAMNLSTRAWRVKHGGVDTLVFVEDSEFGSHINIYPVLKIVVK